MQICSFKENGKLTKHFCLVPRGLILPAGSDTPQNKILRGIRPRGINSCRKSDPAKQWPSSVHFIADACSAGSGTPQNNVPRGIKPQGTTFQYEYILQFETEFKNIVEFEFRDYMGSIRGKTEVENLVLLSLKC
jgi:hypothetical protein